MRQVIIKVQRMYIKDVEVSLTLPDTVELEDVDLFLLSNSQLYQETVDKKLNEADPHFHDENWRYDVYEKQKGIKHIWGGTL